MAAPGLASTSAVQAATRSGRRSPARLDGPQVRQRASNEGPPTPRGSGRGLAPAFIAVDHLRDELLQHRTRRFCVEDEADRSPAATGRRARKQQLGPAAGRSSPAATGPLERGKRWTFWGLRPFGEKDPGEEVALSPGALVGQPRPRVVRRSHPGRGWWSSTVPGPPTRADMRFAVHLVAQRRRRRRGTPPSSTELEPPLLPGCRELAPGFGLRTFHRPCAVAAPKRRGDVLVGHHAGTAVTAGAASARTAPLPPNVVHVAVGPCRRMVWTGSSAPASQRLGGAAGRLASRSCRTGRSPSPVEDRDDVA
jgi:hypothetical protein